MPVHARVDSHDDDDDGDGDDVDDAVVVVRWLLLSHGPQCQAMPGDTRHVMLGLPTPHSVHIIRCEAAAGTSMISHHCPQNPRRLTLVSSGVGGQQEAGER